jgi:microcystin-dependent protein
MTNVATLQTAADLSASITAQGISSLVPAGVILAFGGATAPTGWLLCNGAAISRVTYLNLFNAIGTAHGYGDNIAVTGTFNLPDYRGRFIRGVDGAVARDPNRATRTAANTGGNTGDNVGSVQVNATARPTTAFTTAVASVTGSTSSTIPTSAQDIVDQANSNFSAPGFRAKVWNAANATQTISGTAAASSVTGGGDSETRPLNAYVNYIIKI